MPTESYSILAFWVHAQSCAIRSCRSSSTSARALRAYPARRRLKRAMRSVLLLLVAAAWPALADHMLENLRYRFIFTQVADMFRADGCAFSELMLFSADEGRPMLVGSARNPGGNSVNSEGPHAAIDGENATKFVDLNFPVRNETIFELRLPIQEQLAGYRLTTAEDAPQRDPISWRVEVCRSAVQCDSGNWEHVHTVTDAIPPLSRLSAYDDFWLTAPPPPNPPLPVYRLVVTQVRGAPRRGLAQRDPALRRRRLATAHPLRGEHRRRQPARPGGRVCNRRQPLDRVARRELSHGPAGRAAPHPRQLRPGRLVRALHRPAAEGDARRGQARPNLVAAREAQPRPDGSGGLVAALHRSQRGAALGALRQHHRRSHQ